MGMKPEELDWEEVCETLCCACQLIDGFTDDPCWNDGFDESTRGRLSKLSAQACKIRDGLKTSHPVTRYLETDAGEVFEIPIDEEGNDI